MTVNALPLQTTPGLPSVKDAIRRVRSMFSPAEVIDYTQFVEPRPTATVYERVNANGQTERFYRGQVRIPRNPFSQSRVFVHPGRRPSSGRREGLSQPLMVTSSRRSLGSLA